MSGVAFTGAAARIDLLVTGESDEAFVAKRRRQGSTSGSGKTLSTLVDLNSKGAIQMPAFFVKTFSIRIVR